MDRKQAESLAVNLLKFVKRHWPAANPVSLEVGRDEKNDVLWCKIHRSDEDRTHGGGHLFTVAYLERVEASE